MITQTEWTKIQTLLNAGFSVPQLAGRVGKSTTAIYRLIKTGGPRTSKKTKKYKKVLKYDKYLTSRIKSGVTNINKLFQEIKAQGFSGSYSLLYQYLRDNPIEFRNYKQSQHRETGPGEEAQVDWGHFGKIEINGRTERLYCFVYVLSYSRAKYIEFTVRQNIPTLKRCHMNAFNTLGIPKSIMYDNMKTIVANRIKLSDGAPKARINAKFSDFAKYYKFEVNPHAPYWPRSKGKVEAVVKFVRNNFMQGMKFKRDFKSLDDLNNQAKGWLDRVANKVKHSVTGESPLDRWGKEKPFLTFTTNIPPYEISIFQQVFSTKDRTIPYKSSVYPVPYGYARRKLSIKEISDRGMPLIEIYDSNEIIAKYSLSCERNQWIKESDAIFFKTSEEQKLTKRHRINSERLGKNYPSITRRPLSYYNQIAQNMG